MPEMAMMKNLILLFIIIGVIGCQDSDEPSDNACPTVETLNQFPWVHDLAEMADAFCQSCEHSVARGTYHDQTVIFLLMNDPLCNSTFRGPLQNCSGKIVKSFSNSPADLEEANKVVVETILYRCH